MWQDDGDTKYKTKHVLLELESVFAQRFDPKRQAAKITDVWPIENAWAMFYEKARGEKFHSIEDLKKYLEKIGGK